MQGNNMFGLLPQLEMSDNLSGKLVNVYKENVQVWGTYFRLESFINFCTDKKILLFTSTESELSPNKRSSTDT